MSKEHLSILLLLTRMTVPEQAPEEAGGISVTWPSFYIGTRVVSAQQQFTVPGLRTSQMNEVIGRGTSPQLAAEYSIAAFDHMGLFELSLIHSGLVRPHNFLTPQR